MDINRIIANADFDGLVGALLLRELLGVEEVAFVEPWQLDGAFATRKTDAAIGLPCPRDGCGLWISNAAHVRSPSPHEYFDVNAKSSSSVVMVSYPGAGEKLSRFLPLVAAANMACSADYSPDELRSPDAAMRIAMTLNRASDTYREFLLEQLAAHSLDEVAAINIVQARYREAALLQEELVARANERSERRGSVLLVDFTDEKHSDALLPSILGLAHDASVILIIFAGEEPGRVRISISENPFNRLQRVDIGKLMREFGGDGNAHIGYCTIPAAQRDELLDRIIAALND